MRYRQYKFKFYLNARHYIYCDGQKGELHPHSWEIVLHMVKARGGFVSFSELEGKIDEYFSKYTEKTINEIKPFDVINPTLENVAELFKDEVSNILNSFGWILIMMEMSETPSRTYVINLLDDIELSEDQMLNTFTDLILENIKNDGKG